MGKGLNWCARWLLILLLLSSSACQEDERAPRRDFTTESLLMDETMFPKGWEIKEILPTADSHGAFEHLLRTAYAPGVVVVHEIYRYEFVTAAHREYQRQLDVLFPDTPLYDQWRPTEDLRAALTFADEAYVACAQHGRPADEKVTNCRMLARYHEYVVRFSTQVVPPYLTFEDLAEVLSSLDSRFAAAMQSSTISHNGQQQSGQENGRSEGTTWAMRKHYAAQFKAPADHRGRKGLLVRLRCGESPDGDQRG